MPRHGSAVTYSHVSTHLSFEEAKLAIHTSDTFQYITAYNYGSCGNAKVYRCVSHEACARRLRILETNKDDEEIPVTFQLAVTGQHGTQATNRRRVGIHLSVKGEVDGLLARGFRPIECHVALLKKYADQPAMLAKVPDVSQLKNRLMTLKKHGWKIPDAATATATAAASDSSSSAASSSPVRRSSRKRRVRVESSESDTADEYVASTVEDGASSARQENIELDSEKVERFDKEKLMEEFTALPGRPVFWSILKEIRYMSDKNEVTVTEWITGQVIGWQTSEKSPTKWMVRFTDGEKRGLELEELVDEIRASAQLGLNVTGRPLEF